jgi:hypothetical protein
VERAGRWWPIGENADFRRRFHRGDAEDAEFFWVEEETGFFRKTRFLLLDADDAEFFWVEEDERRGAQNVDFRMGTDRKSSPGRGFS